MFNSIFSLRFHFNPRSLTGATTISNTSTNTIVNFNPRSLTGAT